MVDAVVSDEPRPALIEWAAVVRVGVEKRIVGRTYIYANAMTRSKGDRAIGADDLDRVDHAGFQ